MVAFSSILMLHFIGGMLALLICLFVSFRRKLRACDAALAHLSAQQEDLLARLKDCISAQSSLRGQMFIHEANLVTSTGLWCLEHKGERKYFRPGRLERTESSSLGETSEFSYDEVANEVTCTILGSDGVHSKIVYTLAGAPKRGQIFKEGKLVKAFSYNELGQVI